jgi:hypothetical protein
MILRACRLQLYFRSGASDRFRKVHRGAAGEHLYPHQHGSPGGTKGCGIMSPPAGLSKLAKGRVVGQSVLDNGPEKR